MNATFAGRWRSAVDHLADRPFLAFEDAEGRVTSWTHGEFDQLVASVAAELAHRGVGPGRSVHLALANSPAFVAVRLAVTQLGAWIVPSDPAATAPEIAEHVKRTSPVVGVCAERRLDTYREGATGGPEIVAVDEADPEVGGLRADPAPWATEPPRDRAAVRFAFAGRRSDVLKVAGENVSVVEVEAVLAEHPSVLEAAVVGEPGEIRGEVPVGFVVQQRGRPPLTEAELLAWCEQRLSKAKRPRRVEIVDELPRTSVGKIRKFLLKQGEAR